MKIYLFGAGKNGDYYLENNDKSSVVAFIDNNNTKNGTMHSGLPVLSYKEFKNKFVTDGNSTVIITSTCFYSIYKQLCSDGYGKYVSAFSLRGGVIDCESFIYYKQFLNITESLPSHKDKENIINEIMHSFNKNVLVETGTYLGATVSAFKDKVKWVSSIEVKKELYDAVVDKFKDCPNVHLYLGDSSDKLQDMISDIPPDLRGEVLFFLDGHYSAGITGKGKKDTPILEETEIIAKFFKSNVVLLIDDARLFKKGGTETYPDYTDFVLHLKKLWNNVQVFRESDIIHVIVP